MAKKKRRWSRFLPHLPLSLSPSLFIASHAYGVEKDGRAHRKTAKAKGRRSAGERQWVPRSISISDYFTSTESTRRGPCTAIPSFSCFPPSTASADFVFSIPLRSALGVRQYCAKKNTLLQNTTPLPHLRGDGGAAGKEKETERMHASKAHGCESCKPCTLHRQR